MNDEARKLFEDLGSTVAKELAFRDSWVFVGAKGIENKSPFEQVRHFTTSGFLGNLFCVTSYNVNNYYAVQFWEGFLHTILTDQSIFASPLEVTNFSYCVDN